MDNNFQQTVNLKEKMERQRKMAEKKAMGAIERIYQPEDEAATKKELQQISRPQQKQFDPMRWRFIIILALTLVIVMVSWLFLKPKIAFLNFSKNKSWYAVTLKTNEEMYYGQISNIKANPIELNNVYYNYDQINKDASKDEATTETGTLRLVKRGKETYGPSGSMLIYQAEIKTVDLLAKDSKVLKAILDYEK